MIYFDTSALAKKYVIETGSEGIARLMTEKSIMATSKLTYPEMLSALTRRSREGDIPHSKLKELLTEFEADWKCFLIIDFQDELLVSIKRLIEKYYLRAADSIHLASALWLKHSMKENITFVASDTNLLNAARAEKLSVVNPQDS